MLPLSSSTIKLNCVIFSSTVYFELRIKACNVGLYRISWTQRFEDKQWAAVNLSTNCS